MIRRVLLAFALGMPGCTSVSDGDVVEEPAVIIFHGDTAHVEVPDTVPAGTPFEIRVETFAGGCVRQIARTDVSSEGGVVRVVPYNLRSEQPICTSDLIFLVHSATASIDRPGVATIRVRGEQRGTDAAATPAELTRTVIVR